MDWWKDNKKPNKDFFDKMAPEFNKIESLFDEIPEGKDENEIKEIETKSKIAEGLIKHYLDLTKVLDQRRGDYYKAALQLIAIGLTGLGLLLKFITTSPISLILLIAISICIGLAIMIITSFLVIKCFYWQTKSDRYHFLKIDTNKVPNLGNSWEWFYHGVEGLSKIPFTDSEYCDKEKLKLNELGVEGYVTGASFYFDKFIKSTPRDLYIQNLKHAYLLLVHNAYKNKFERQLTNIMSRGMNVTSWVVILAILLSILLSVLSSNIPLTGKDESASSINMTILKQYKLSEELEAQSAENQKMKLDSVKGTKNKTEKLNSKIGNNPKKY
ncbi:hypothetical protein [Chryseobacterium arthrosphaerae]|uniref:hypothetical protein n=1 Tax=Chryseobacterium arthrosphaerae TaxID=651561 RepID=UPI001F4A5554|nr:hypothetical protein [Chryseobacterium arthrosphaerae]